MRSLPKVFYGGNLVVSDEVFTIEDEALNEGAPLEVLEPPDDFVEDDLLGDEDEKSPDEKIALDGTRREAEEILKNARDEAAMILNKASIQAQLDRDHLLEKTAAEMEVVKRQAYEEAYQKGLSEGVRTQAQALQECMEQLVDGVSRLEGEQAGFMAEYEYNLKWLAWEIASKVLGRKLEEDETELVSLVKMAVASVKNAEWITVEVSEKASSLLESLEKEFRRLGDDRVDIRGISAPEGTCIIDTPDGLIDASVYSQLENLRIYFSGEDNE